MQIIRSINSLRKLVSQWRQALESVGFVPTMGNLHQGHLSLVEEAKKNNDRVVVSIFVNPTQFGEGEDFVAYPRTASADREKLDDAQVDALFFPETDDIYGPDFSSAVIVNGLSESHCGASREGHFSGVATIVCKLFNIVQPDTTYFGKKDFQQLAVIRQMVRDLNIPVAIKDVATVREADGLAMSSRNCYLTAEQRALAPKLYQVLQNAKDAILANDDSYAAIQAQQIQNLQKAGLQPEYFSICRSNDLKPAKILDTELVILAAVKLGKTRLIDNLEFNIF